MRTLSLWLLMSIFQRQTQKSRDSGSPVEERTAGVVTILRQFLHSLEILPFQTTVNLTLTSEVQSSCRQEKPGCLIIRVLNIFFKGVCSFQEPTQEFAEDYENLRLIPQTHQSLLWFGFHSVWWLRSVVTNTCPFPNVPPGILSDGYLHFPYTFPGYRSTSVFQS